MSTVTGVLMVAAALTGWQERTVGGRVLLLPDSTPVRGVRVAVLPDGPGARTDGTGRFAIDAAPAGPLRLGVTGAGIARDTAALPAGRDTITIGVRRAPVALDPVVILGARPLARQRFEEAAQPSVASLGPAEISATPGLLEADVLRTVQLLPGTVARNDYSVGYNVRGGEADQNLILIDGIPIFNPSHLAGLFSTFDANAVSRVDFFTGGFPARYPGRLSSVLDLSLRTGDRTATRVSGQVSLLSSKALVDGPLGGGSYLVGARRTYADAVVSAFSSEVLPYYFTDLIGKTSLPLGDGVVSATAYWGRDALDLNLVSAGSGRDRVDLDFAWGNALAGVSWRHPVGRGLLEHHASVSSFSTVFGLLPDLVRFDNRVRLFTVGTSWAPAPDAAHDLRIGAELAAHRMDYLGRSPSLETTFLDSRFQPTIWSVFADDTWRAAPWLLLRPGVRAEYVDGPDAALVSPRLAAKVFLNDVTAVTASAGRYYQAIHSIRDQEVPVTIYEFWIGADEFIPVARSDQLVLGLERWLGSAWEIKAEGWRKGFQNLVTPNRAQNFSVRGDEFVPARGDAWGVDLLVRRHSGRIRGWLACGFQRTTRRAEGVEFPPAHDRRHTVNLVLQAPGPLGSSMGVRWGYGSPLPYTGFTGEWFHRLYNATDNTYDDVRDEPLPAAINGERYPPWHRLDLGFRWSFEKFGGQWQPYLQVANVYNRRNVFVYFFDYDVAPPTRTGVSQLPVLPTVGMEFVF